MADLKKKKFVAADNPIEQVKDFGIQAVNEAASVPKAIFDEALNQIGLKPQKKPLRGEISLSTGVHKTNQEVDRKEANLDRKMQQLHYVQNQEKEVFSAQKKAVESQVAKLLQELHAEVAKLEKQTSELTSEVRAATVEMVPPNAGTYHINFFDWVIGTLRDLRKRVNESRLWLNMWTAKKKQKGYWAMTKKHGQQFQMSDERSVATAAG